MERVKTEYTGLEIAIIGMSGRVPGAENLTQFWTNLVEGQESISYFTEDELLAAGVNPQDLRDPNFVPAKGIIPNLENFDAEFFNYTPKDASLLDPQVRVLHEEVFHALEDAGYASEDSRETIGLFLGATNNIAWELETLKSTLDSGGHHITTLQLNDKDFGPTRISYSLNLQGPSVSVYSACSTSLYAVDMACRHILTGACTIAVAGGSGLSLPNRNGYLTKDGRINSPDGHCRPFDQDAVGTVEGNGAGVVVLKRLEDAMKDRDRIYAVIRGTACNNDGNRKVGYMAPSIEGQAEVIRRAIAMADVHASSISYIEAHGTGTILGDPIEIAGLKKAYQTASQGSIGVGSLKSNIGHLDTAAGVASLIKTALALENRIIPASLNFTKANPQLDIENSPFHIVSERTPWRRKAISDELNEYSPLRAGISSFGIGGTNVHMIIEEAPEREPSGVGRDWKLLCLSAHTDTALRRLKEDYLEQLRGSEAKSDPSDLAWSLQTRQRSMAKRFTLSYREIDDLVDGLATDLEGGNCPRAYQHTASRGKPSVYFLFPGHGSQYLGMALDLYRTEPVFRDELEVCLKWAEEEGHHDLRQILLHPESGDEQRLSEADLSQLSLFVIEYSLARLLMSWGIQPAGMIGHSLGEYTAACLSGVFTLREAIRLVIARGRLMKSMPSGSMLSVNASAEMVSPLLTEGLSLAAINSPNKCTVSGSNEAIDTFEKQLAERKLMSIRMQTTHGFHSVLMDGAMEQYKLICDSVDLERPQIPYVSNLSGDWITSQDATDSSYYTRHMRECVNFAKGIETILSDERAVLVEVGPGRILSAFARQTAVKQPLGVVNILRDSIETDSDDAYLVQRLGELWCFGVALNWKAYYKGQIRNRLPVPLYPFEATKFPIGQSDLSQLLIGMERGMAPIVAPVAATREVAYKDVEREASRNSKSMVKQLHWESTFLPLAEKSPQSRTCLILTDATKIVHQLMKHLPRWRSVVARNGSSYLYEGTLGASIRHGNDSDMGQLLQDLRQQALLPNTIFVAQSSNERTEKELRLLVNAIKAQWKAELPEIVVLSPHSPVTKNSGLPALVWGTRVEQPDLKVRLIDTGIPLRTKQAAEIWALVLKRELATDPQRYPVVYYSNNQRFVPRFRVMNMNRTDRTTQFKKDHLVLLSHENNLVKSFALTENLGESLGARISILPYGLQSNTADEKTFTRILKEMNLNEERVQLLPAVKVNNVSGVELALKEALQNLPHIDGMVFWDEFGMEEDELAIPVNRFVGQTATNLQKPAMIVSVLAQPKRWDAHLTEWIMAHEKLDVDSNIYRLYLPFEGDETIDEVSAAVKEMLLSGIKRAVINPEQHPLFTWKPREQMNDDNELIELENTLKSIWGNLFGVEDIDIDADFFELGGDSFKLFQMSLDLERMGHNLLMNEVYKYSNIRSLARYLCDKDQSKSKDIITPADLEEKLCEVADTTACRLCTIDGDQPRRILFFDEKVEGGFNAVRQHLRFLRVPYDLLPHYILPFSLAEKLPEAPRIEDLVKLEALSDAEGTIFEQIDGRIKEEQEILNQAILSQPVQSRYELSKIQKMHFGGEVRLQLYLVDFFDVVDEELLERAFCDVVGSHGLLRSSLYKNLWEYRWKEHAPPQITPIPKLDISHLTPVAQTRVIDELVKREWDADFKETGKIMFHVILIKWNEKHYELFFQFDHSVIDLSSGQVLRRQLHKRYNELKNGSRSAMELSTSYQEFVEQVKQGPIGIDEAGLISAFDVLKYREYTLKVGEKLKGKRGRIHQLRFEVPLSSFNFEKDDEQGIFEMALQIYILSLSRLVDVDAVPFDLYFVNRRYQGKNFSDVIGMILDSIPYIIPADRENPSSMTTIMREKIQLINQYNVNFSNMDSTLASKWRWRKLRALNPIEDKTVRGQLVLNYTSGMEREYVQIWDRSLAQLDVEDQRKLDYGDFYGLARLIDNKLEFAMLCKFADEQELQKIFEEETTHMIKLHQKNR